uniref:AP complex mu/sigma subunit domain-containing protein n=1 Tax=Ursus americanus TaxID=9643 RepID=A0A452QRT3_URSAM
KEREKGAIYRNTNQSDLTCVCINMDVNDNNLPHLKTSSFVEILNECFREVWELVFNFYKVYTVVNEMSPAGEVGETSQILVVTQLLRLPSLQ